MEIVFLASKVNYHCNLETSETVESKKKESLEYARLIYV